MRFNQKINPMKHDTTNLENTPAFQESPELELVSLMVTSFVNDKFYRKAGDELMRMAEIVSQLPDKSFAGKAAIYARDKFHVRSITHVLAYYIGKYVKGEEWTKFFFERVIQRPDDILEILALWINNEGEKPRKTKLPNAMKKGFGKALLKFDEYQLSKYKKSSAKISLIDAVNLVHPKANEALTKLIKNELKPADTWETSMTQAGQKAETDEEKQELKAQEWKRLIESRKIGYFALLRNLRNIFQQCDTDTIDKALDLLLDERLIKKSKVLPFRYLVAYEIFREHSGKIMSVISKAADIAFQNVPELDGKTAVALDCSGSMHGGGYHGTPAGKQFWSAALFAACLVKNNADLVLFSNDAFRLNLNPDDSLLTMVNQMESNAPWGGTNTGKVFDVLGEPYDRVVIITDEQSWMGGFRRPPTEHLKRYKKLFNCDPIIHSIDVAGYGTLQFPEKKIYCMAGFSEAVFDVMKLVETDKRALVNAVQSIEL